MHLSEREWNDKRIEARLVVMDRSLKLYRDKNIPGYLFAWAMRQPGYTKEEGE